jgi:hypothetical protein
MKKWLLVILIFIVYFEESFSQNSHLKKIEDIQKLIISDTLIKENNQILLYFRFELEEKKLSILNIEYSQKLNEISSIENKDIENLYKKIHEKVTLNVSLCFKEYFEGSEFIKTKNKFKLKDQNELPEALNKILEINTNLRLLQTICYQLILYDKIKEIEDSLSNYYTIKAHKADSVKIYKRINNLDSITNTKLSTKKFNDTIKNYLKTNQFDSLFDSKIQSYLEHFPKPSTIDTTAIYKFINNKDTYIQSQIKNLNDTIVQNKTNFECQLQSKASIDSVNRIILNYRENYFKEDFKKEVKKKWWIPALLFANTLTTLLLLLSKN